MNQTGFSSNGPKCFGTSRRTSFVDIRDNDIPGPGSHNQSRIDRQTPTKWTFGTDTQRDTFLQKYPRPNPSPTQYNPNPQPTLTSHPQYTIPRNQNIQPANYKQDQNSRLNYRPNTNINKYEAPKYSFGYFKQHDYSTPVPPPNNYKNNKKLQDKQYFNKTQSFFTKSDRPMPYGQQYKYPGIGQYSISKQQSMNNTSYSYKFGNSQKFQQIKIQGSIPIKTYDISKDIKQPGKGWVMMRPYFEEVKKKQDQTYPAPNHYNPKYLESKRKIISFTGKRSQLYEKDLIKYPSPQKHVTSSDFYKTRKSLSFTKQSRQTPLLQFGPGPAKYNIQKQLSNQQGYMGRKLKKHQLDITPAASDYNPIDYLTKPNNQRVINYDTERVDFSRSITGKVGPGDYQLDKNTRKQLGKMSKSLKLQGPNNKNPGPGFYQIPTTIGKLPKYYCGQKKMTDTGFSTFALQMKQKTLQRQQWLKQRKLEKQKQQELQQKRRQQQTQTVEQKS